MATPTQQLLLKMFAKKNDIEHASNQKKIAELEDRKQFRFYKRNILAEFKTSSSSEPMSGADERIEAFWKEGLSVTDAVRRLRHAAPQ